MNLTHHSIDKISIFEIKQQVERKMNYKFTIILLYAFSVLFVTLFATPLRYNTFKSQFKRSIPIVFDANAETNWQPETVEEQVEASCRQVVANFELVKLCISLVSRFTSHLPNNMIDMAVARQIRSSNEQQQSTSSDPLLQSLLPKLSRNNGADSMRQLLSEEVLYGGGKTRYAAANEDSNQGRWQPMRGKRSTLVD